IRGKNELLRRIDRERSAHGTRTSHGHLRFDIAIGSAIKNQETGSASFSVTTATAGGHNEKIISRVDSQCVHAAARVRPLDRAFGRHVSVAHAVINENLVALRNINL